MQRIALLGLPGCGKSTVGALLAQRLGFSFEDIDDCVENYSGWHPRRWIEEKGLSTFRAVEALMLAAETQREDSPRVLATGGGVVETTENLQRLPLWRCIWLDAPDEELLRRCQQGNRPLLDGQDPPRLMARLRQQRQVHFRELCGDPVETDRISPSEVVDAIVRRLEEVD